MSSEPGSEHLCSSREAFSSNDSRSRMRRGRYCNHSILAVLRSSLLFTASLLDVERLCSYKMKK